MFFTLGLVGYTEDNQELEKVIKNSIENIKILPLDVVDNYSILPSINLLKKIISKCDAILYSSKILHDLFNNKISHSVPCSFIEHSRPEIFKALLKASLVYEDGIKNISADSIKSNGISYVYKSLNMNQTNDYSIDIVEAEYTNMGFIDDMVESHILNQKRNNAICITGLTSVYTLLLMQGCKVILLENESTSLIQNVKSLMAKCNIIQKKKPRIAILSITVSNLKENLIIEDSQHEIILEYNRIAEEIYWFSQKVNGTFIATSRKSYSIFCDSRLLENQTYNYTKFDLLDAIAEKQIVSLSIGVGYGTNHKDAMKHSTVAYTRAASHQGNNAFVMYNTNEIIGPFLPSNQDVELEDTLYDVRLSQIANTCSLSINTMYKLKGILSKDASKTYTSRELSENLGVTQRTVNRTLQKLEEFGYVESIGLKSEGGKGRPCRVFKFYL